MRNEVSSIGKVQPIELDARELGDPRIGHHAQGGEGGFGHPVENLAVVLVADRAHGDAARRHLEFHLRHRGHHVGELGAAERAVQHRNVVGIDHILEVLQPITRNNRRSAAADGSVVGLDEFAVVHLLEAFVARQHRLFLGRPHIGEDQAIAFLNRVPGLAHLVPELAAVGFAGLLQAAALGVELPAVIATADAVLLNLAVIERRAAVTATGVEQASAAEAVAEQDQILGKGADFPGHVDGVGGESDRVPIAPQQFPHRRAAADLGQFRPGRGGPHGVGGAEIAIPLGRVHVGSLRSGLGGRFVDLDQIGLWAAERSMLQPGAPVRFDSGKASPPTAAGVGFPELSRHAWGAAEPSR